MNSGSNGAKDWERDALVPFDDEFSMTRNVWIRTRGWQQPGNEQGLRGVLRAGARVYPRTDVVLTA